jgi:hypothetical protein
VVWTPRGLSYSLVTEHPVQVRRTNRNSFRITTFLG